MGWLVDLSSSGYAPWGVAMAYGRFQSMRFSDRNLGKYICYLDWTSKGEGESSVDLEITLSFHLCSRAKSWLHVSHLSGKFLFDLRISASPTAGQQPLYRGVLEAFNSNLKCRCIRTTSSFISGSSETLYRFILCPLGTAPQLRKP